MGKLRVSAGLFCERYHVHPAVLDRVFQMVGFGKLEGAARDKVWVPASINSLELKQSSCRTHIQPGSKESMDQWVWASVRLVESSARVQVVNIEMYNVIAGDVSLSVQGFRCGALKPQPPAVALYDVHLASCWMLMIALATLGILPYIAMPYLLVEFSF